MPEGPEVHHLTDQLNKELKNTAISLIVSDKYDRFKQLIAPLQLKVKEVKCKGKLIYFCLQDNLFIINHLAMSGHWGWIKGEHTFVELDYLKDDKEKKLYYNDPRGFGKFDLLTENALRLKLGELGPDVLSPEFTKETFMECINGVSPDKVIGNVLNDQKVISGIGNYLRSEILFHCRISPRAKISQLDKTKLYESIINKVRIAYYLGGSTGYSDINGKKGGYKPVIYGQNWYYDHEIKTVKMGSQTFYYVPDLQK
jgi:DNA-formamidopyrimidine glycosylase